MLHRWYDFDIPFYVLQEKLTICVMRWKKRTTAMYEEFAAPMKNKRWHFVPPNYGNKIIDYTWVYRIRRHANGNIHRYKARLIANGFKKCYAWVRNIHLV